MGGIGSGGPREGAGRKSAGGSKVKISARVPAWMLDLIKAEADRRRCTTSGIINELLTKGLES